MKHFSIYSVICTALGALQVCAQIGGPYTLNWNTCNGGGGGGGGSGGVTPLGGTKFSLSGTIGQPDAGTSAAGTYALQSGFAPGLIKTAGPLVTLTRNGSQFTFTWPNTCAGFMLEASPTVDGPVWTSLGGGTVIGGNRQLSVDSSSEPAELAFFRLRKNCPANCASHCPE